MIHNNVLFGHFRVAAQKEHNKMPAENLAKVWGPTIVGYSDLQLSSAFDDTSKQEQVIMFINKVSLIPD